MQHWITCFFCKAAAAAAAAATAAAAASVFRVVSTLSLTSQEKSRRMLRPR